MFSYYASTRRQEQEWSLLSLNAKLIQASEKLPERFKVEKDGTLLLEAKVAERKVFMSKKTLTYKARLRVDDQNKGVRFFEMLKETGMGLTSSGGPGDVSPGIGFKTETYKTGAKTREGNIEEQSRLFGKDYKYSWDYSNVRKTVEQEARDAGYSFTVVLMERSL
jgi:hypothetical protein